MRVDWIDQIRHMVNTQRGLGMVRPPQTQIIDWPGQEYSLNRIRPVRRKTRVSLWVLVGVVAVTHILSLQPSFIH